MKTILVTGSSGFIGWKTSQLLLENNINVVGLDNMNDYYDIRLKEYRLHKLKKYENFIFHKMDIEKMDSLLSLFSKYYFDAVINLAARAGVRYSIENPHVYISTNVQGTLNLLEMMRKFKVPKIILASTSSLYAGQNMPFSEKLAVNTPISQYAASKKAAEVICYTYHYLYNIDVTIVRYFTVYGPAGRPDMSIFRFIKWIDEGTPIELFGDGSQTRDFTYVDDIAQGTIKALKDVKYEIINLGGGKKPISINYVIRKIEKYLDREVKINYLPFHKADLKGTSADISKANHILNWKPTVNFDLGLKKCIDWYIDNKKWIKDINI